MFAWNLGADFSPPRASVPTLRSRTRHETRFGLYPLLCARASFAPCLAGGSTLGAIVALAERDPALFLEFSSVGEEEDDDLQSRGKRRTRRINGGAAPQDRLETVRQRQARAQRTGGIVWDSIK